MFCWKELLSRSSGLEDQVNPTNPPPLFHETQSSKYTKSTEPTKPKKEDTKQNQLKKECPRLKQQQSADKADTKQGAAAAKQAITRREDRIN